MVSLACFPKPSNRSLFPAQLVGLAGRLVRYYIRVVTNVLAICVSSKEPRKQERLWAAAVFFSVSL